MNKEFIQKALNGEVFLRFKTEKELREEGRWFSSSVVELPSNWGNKHQEEKRKLLGCSLSLLNDEIKKQLRENKENVLYILDDEIFFSGDYFTTLPITTFYEAY